MSDIRSFKELKIRKVELKAEFIESKIELETNEIKKEMLQVDYELALHEVADVRRRYKDDDNV